MDDLTHAAHLAYIRTLGDALLLRDWELLLSRAVADARDQATILLHDGKNQGEVALGRDWMARTPEERRRTMTHELLHCHTARLCRVLTRLGEEDKSDLAIYVIKAFDNEEEIVIDTLARILAPLMPLPPEGC
jgi:hypothetical protein